MSQAQERKVPVVDTMQFQSWFGLPGIVQAAKSHVSPRPFHLTIAVDRSILNQEAGI